MMSGLAIEKDKKYTYSDYLLIEDEKRYEVLEGELIMVPAPTTTHQRISRNIEFILQNFVSDNDLGEILYAPTDVVLSDDEVVQPDILFVSKGRTAIIEERAIMGAPDLIIEILSPSSTFYDVVKKKEIYQRYGVSEYWLVFPEEKAIEVMTLEGDTYREYSVAKDEGKVRSKVLEGLEVDLKGVF